jgi:hypothetical protein
MTIKEKYLIINFLIIIIFINIIIIIFII